MELNINKYRTPIALFGFNRPRHIFKTLSALVNCNNASLYELYIFIDKHTGQNPILNEEVYNVCIDFDWPGEKYIYYRNENLGLAMNIQSGIEQIFQTHDTIIVLEDDIIVSKYFLDYMSEALMTYHSELKVMHVNGYLPNIKYKNLLGETFFTQTMYCWGWATWKDRWTTYNSDSADLLEKVNKSKKKDTFGNHGQSNFKAQLIANSEGKLNTWAIKWYSSIFLNAGVCLTPNKSLTQNIGMDGTGVHYKDSQKNYPNDDVKATSSRIKIVKLQIAEKSLTKWIFMNFYAFGSKPSLVSSLRLFMSYTCIGRFKRYISN